MAEIVQFRIEQLVDVLSSVEKLGIFTRDETKTVINRLRGFEYRIQKSKKSKEDYLTYVDYLQNLISLIRQRKRKTFNSLKFREIEVRLTTHGKKLLRNVVNKYQEDVKLWFRFINFCKNMHLYEDVGKIFMRMLQVHPDKPDIWIKAAKFQWKQNRSSDLARSILQQGIRHLPECLRLWLEYFRMELKYSDLVRTRKKVLTKPLQDGQFNEITETVDFPQDKADAILTGRLPIIVFEKAMDQFPNDPSIGKNFMEILNEFEPQLRVGVKKEMLSLMEKYHPESVETVIIKADCFMDEFYNHFNGYSVNGEGSSKACRLEIANQIFREAIEKMPSIKLWNAFIGFNLQYSKNYSGNISANQQNFILCLMQECWTAGFMSLAAFIHWVTRLEMQKNFTKLSPLLREGCKKWSNNRDVWYARLSIMSQDLSLVEETKKLFFKALREINDEDHQIDEQDGIYLPLCSIRNKTVENIWQLFVQWSAHHLSPKQVIRLIEKYFTKELPTQKSVTLQRKIGSLLKPHLLKKAIELQPDGLDLARQLYEKYKNHHPIIRGFCQEMLKIELAAQTIDANKIRIVFNDYIENFGSSDHRIWLEFCKFEIKHGKPENLGNIHVKACRTLKSGENDKFLSGYCLLQNSINS